MKKTWIALALGASFIVAGCGGSSNTSSGSHSGSGSSSSASGASNGSGSGKSSATSVSSGSGAPSPGSAGQIVVATPTPAYTLDPHFSNSYVTRVIDAGVFDELVTYNEQYKIMPDLATSWKATNGNKTWTFELAQGIKFQNGQTMTSKDVVASLNRYMNYGVGGKKLKALVASVSAQGPNAVVLKLNKADANLTALLANPLTFIAIMPAKYASSSKKLSPPDLIGTGPYEISKWIPDQYTVVTRFSGYTPPNKQPATGFGGDKIAYFNSIKYAATTAQETRLSGLETGQYQYAESLPYSAYPQLKTTSGIKPVVVSPDYKVVWYVNEYQQPTQNVWMRRAMVAALDDNAILKFITGGNTHFYQLDSSLFFPGQKAWYDPKAGAGIYNQPNAAVVKADLKKAGYKGQTITVLTNHQYFWMYDASVAAVKQWQADGINAKLDVMTWPRQLTYLTKKSGWSLFTSGNSTRFDPSDYSPILNTGGSSDFGFSNAQIDNLMQQGESTNNLQQRIKAYDQVQKLAWKYVPQIQVGEIDSLDGSVTGLKNFRAWYIPRFWNTWITKK